MVTTSTVEEQQVNLELPAFAAGKNSGGKVIFLGGEGEPARRWKRKSPADLYGDKQERDILSLICGVEYSILSNQCTMIYTVLPFHTSFKTKFLSFHTPFETMVLPFHTPFDTKFLPFHTPKNCTWEAEQERDPFTDLRRLQQF